MGFLFTGAFWGIFLILIGISVLIKVFFNIDFPIFRLFFGLFFIVIGLNIILGWNLGKGDSGKIFFGEGTFNASEEGGKYNVFFGKGTTDLTASKVSMDQKIEINTIFSDNTVYIPKGTPIAIRASAAFGQIEFPDGNSAAFGSYNYYSKEYKSDKPYLKIELNTVFGATRVLIKEK